MSDERKLTGTGHYKIPTSAYGQEEEDDYYAEDFEGVRLYYTNQALV